MECFTFIVLAGVMVVAIVAWRRASQVGKRAAGLEVDIAGLRHAVTQLRQQIQGSQAPGEPPGEERAPSRQPAAGVWSGPETPAEPISIKALAAAFPFRGDRVETPEAVEAVEAVEATEPTEPGERSEPGAAVPEPPVTPTPTPAQAPASPAPPPLGARPPSSPPEPPAAAPPPAGRHGGFEWERWLGIRGAAVLGGVVLALAALLFLKYAVEQGFFPPIVRLTVAVLAGLGTLVGSQTMRRRDYGITADAVAGAGIVILYGAVWAGHSLYHLIPAVLAFFLMVLVTTACAGLAWRHRSLVVAILGLAGGFAAPLVLASLRAEPLGLFGYLMLLNFGLLVLSRRNGWPLLGALGLLVTTLYVVLWLGGFVSVLSLGSGLGIVGLFAIVFVAAGSFGGSGIPQGAVWTGLRSAGLLLPFVFSLRFTTTGLLGDHVYHLGGLLVVLSVAALWLARRLDEPVLSFGAACGVMINAVVWMAMTTSAPALAWESAGVLVVLALVFHLALEVSARDAGEGSLPEASSWLPAMAVAGVFLVLVVLARQTMPKIEVGPWPWIFASVVLTAFALRQRALGAPTVWPVLAALLAAVGQILVFADSRLSPVVSTETILLLTIILALAFSAWPLLRRHRHEYRALEAAAYTFALVCIVLPLSWVDTPQGTVELVLVATLPFVALAGLAATRLRSGWAFGGVVALAALVQWAWTFSSPSESLGALPFVAQLLLVAALTFWPFLSGVSRWEGSKGRGFLVPAALAAPAFFPPLGMIYEKLFGDSTIGLLPVGLGALVLGAAYLSRSLWPAGDSRRTSALAWFSAIALGFLSIAIPLQLDNEWITVGWALEGAAVIALWRRLDHPGLKYFGTALLAVVVVRLLANPAVLDYHPGGARALPVLNWLAYTYLLPAAAMILAARWLVPLEVPRRRPRETSFYPSARPWLAYACGLGAGLVIFAWINLTIFDAFSGGPEIFGSFERQPARDLTLSLAWALYALCLLALGIRRGWAALRWASLLLLIVTILKAFLYDLGELEDLYRVASLVGLAVSLILVSLVYQRFVFRRGGEEEGP